MKRRAYRATEVKNVLLEEVLRSAPVGAATAGLDIGKYEVSAAVFDGVPSQHDGKDAAVIAELAAFGKSTPWPYRVKSESEAELAYWADWLDVQQRIQQLWTGRLESLLARHWPEATRLLDLSNGENRAVYRPCPPPGSRDYST